MTAWKTPVSIPTEPTYSVQGRTCVQFYNPGSKIWGPSHKKKIWGPKMQNYGRLWTTSSFDNY